MASLMATFRPTWRAIIAIVVLCFCTLLLTVSSFHEIQIFRIRSPIMHDYDVLIFRGTLYFERDPSWSDTFAISHESAFSTKGTGAIRDVHSVRVRTTPDGLVVNYHCRVSPYLSVDEVHEHVDELDRKMRAALTSS